MARDAALAKIHIARKELRLAEDDYRALLVRVVGQSTAAKLSEEQQKAVLAEFRRLGWKPTFRGRRDERPGVRMVYGLWSELGRLGVVAEGRNALRAFVKRQTGMEQPEWLDARQLNAVIEGLKAMRSRAKHKGAA